ncbi:plastocyanin/azurin family copper-binding protein [Rubrivirga sp.]|uniref:plastocyanin/azurin family copper-binding protein n=1 Tax=Rubrivirga sp. TaxID=1885344 RepID=UPI003C72A452
MLRLTLIALALTVFGCGDPPGPTPEQLAVFEEEVDLEVVIPSVRNAMRFDVARVEAPAGATVRLVIDNSTTSSPAMIHNVVVLEAGTEVRTVAEAAARERDNVPDDPAILAFTPLAGPGQKTAVVFTMPPPGEYPFVCTYPGHWQTMQGVLVSTR